jgi:trigger factor
MPMTFTLETLDSCRRALRVEVPPEQLAPRLEASFRELGRTVRVPGFRPGKVPRAVLERRFREHVRDEVLRQAIPEHFAGRRLTRVAASALFPEVKRKP